MSVLRSQSSWCAVEKKNCVLRASAENQKVKISKQNNEKIDQVLKKLDLLLNRVDVIERSILNLNKRITNVEDKMGSLEHELK